LLFKYMFVFVLFFLNIDYSYLQTNQKKNLWTF